MDNTWQKPVSWFSAKIGQPVAGKEIQNKNITKKAMKILIFGVFMVGLMFLSGKVDFPYAFQGFPLNIINNTVKT